MAKNLVSANDLRDRGRKIVAIGRNFAEHAKELNNAIPTEPFFFLKPVSSYVNNDQTIEIPKGVVAHFEGEYSQEPGLLLAIAKWMLLLSSQCIDCHPLDSRLRISSCTRLPPTVELAAIIGREGRDIKEADAMSHIAGYGLAIDMTARNMQVKTFAPSYLTISGNLPY